MYLIIISMKFLNMHLNNSCDLLKDNEELRIMRNSNEELHSIQVIPMQQIMNTGSIEARTYMFYDCSLI